MEPTLRVRNEDDNAVTIQDDNGDASTTIDPNAEKHLERGLLISTSFSQLMAAGKVRFVEVQSPTTEEFLLARQILPRLLRDIGGDFVDLHHRMKSEIQGLEKNRQGYNRNWDDADDELQDAGSAKDAADFLYRGVHHFLKAKPEQDLVDTLNAELTTLQEEDLSETEKPFEQWLEEFEAKSRELDLAEQRLAAAEGAYVAGFANLKTALKNASDDFTAVAGQTIGIGTKVPPLAPQGQSGTGLR